MKLQNKNNFFYSMEYLFTGIRLKPDTRSCHYSPAIEAGMNLSSRAYHRILKPARTIADLAERKESQSVPLAEVLQYCPEAD